MVGRSAPVYSGEACQLVDGQEVWPTLCLCLGGALAGWTCHGTTAESLTRLCFCLMIGEDSGEVVGVSSRPPRIQRGGRGGVEVRGDMETTELDFTVT